MKYIILPVICFFILCADALPQNLSDDELTILKIQDGRAPGEKFNLIKYINSDDDNLSVRALLALANLQDSAMSEFAGEVLLKNYSSQRKSMAAFALGEIGTSDAVAYLLKSLESESDKDAICSILDALGYCGNSDALDAILKKNFSDDKINKAVALSIARFAIRGIRSESAVSRLISFVDGNPNDSLEMLTAYAFSRIRNGSLLLPAKSCLRKLLSSPQPFSKMWAYNAFAYIGDMDDLERLISNFETEKNLNVRIAMLNSLSVYKNFSDNIISGKLLSLLINAMDDTDLYIRITAIAQAGNLGSDYDGMSQVAIHLAGALWQKYKSGSITEKAEAIQSYAKIKKHSAENEILNEYINAQNYAIKPAIIRALKYTGDPEVVRKLRDVISIDVHKYTDSHNMSSPEIIQDDTLAAIYRAFIETVNVCKDSASDSTKNFIRLIMLEFLGSKDAPIVDECFNALNSDMYKNFRDELGIVIGFDFNDLTMPEDKEVIKLFIKEISFLKSRSADDVLTQLASSDDFEISDMACKALKNLNGAEIVSDAKRKTFTDYENLKYKNAVIHTNKGDIHLKLYTDIAPMTCLNFIRLAKSNFYNRTLFHRVIPNFVIQGGDPLNTGWGGTDYTIRSEFSPLHFTEGKLGMASDGKDTEGSQFFIMHIPHYHLDGRYTLFGEVISGMDIVNIIFTDDYVISIDVSE